MEEYDALILGGGSGLTAAYHAEAAGQDVAVVEPGPLGGTCVNRGCIPTKTLIQSGEVARTVRSAGDFGIHLDQDSVEADVPAILERMRSMREDNVEHTDGWIEGSEQITLYRDEATFVSEKTVEVDGTTLRGETVFVTTGAEPLIPPVDGLEDVDYLTNKTLLDDLDRQPDHLAILGGGYIGLEFAHFFEAVGTHVTVVELGDPIDREDADVQERVADELGDYATLHTHTLAHGAHQEGDRIRLELRDPETGDDEGKVVADELLVAAGRGPETDALDLEATGVETDEDGWIEVDESLQTSHPDVYAYGDVIGQGMFKHTSSFEGEVAWRASRGEDVAMDYTANPHAIFTRPQVGSVGLTEAEAQDADREVVVNSVDYAEAAKGDIMQASGFAKAIADAETGEVLGFHVVGPEAADLVHEVVVAMTAGDGTVDNVVDAIHVHPTLSELVHSAFVPLA